MINSPHSCTQRDICWHKFCHQNHKQGHRSLGIYNPFCKGILLHILFSGKVPKRVQGKNQDLKKTSHCLITFCFTIVWICFPVNSTNRAIYFWAWTQLFLLAWTISIAFDFLIKYYLTIIRDYYEPNDELATSLHAARHLLA